MESFSLLRTNVGLSSNIKVVIDSAYNLFLESINSVPDLESSRFKKFQFNKDNFYDELVPFFFKDFPSDIAFSVRYGNDVDIMSDNFSNQYDDIYQMGARNISNNKQYPEEYEFLAPLYIFKHKLPKYFMIFRVDGPGLTSMNKDNFRSEFITKLKSIKLFDLTTKTPLGEWMDRNFTKNRSFPNWPLEIDFRNLEFTKWIGIDYNSGGFTSKSKFLDETLENENSIFDLEKYFFDGFQDNKIIYPHIINFNFLFDDTPATPTSLRKWSMNRYCGFYLNDMEIIDSITPFKLSKLKSDIIIGSGNILYSNSGDPFFNGFDPTRKMWVEVDGNFYVVERFNTTESDQLSAIGIGEGVTSDEYSDLSYVSYKIISDLDLLGKQDKLNKKQITVNSNNQILSATGSIYSINGFEYGDINLIEIDGKLHNLILDSDGYLSIYSDYGFNVREDYRFEYHINSPDPNYLNYIDISPNVDPISFKIYRAKFTDIKDFDTQLIDSEFSRFEYEKKEDLTNTEEPKFYTTDLRSKSIPSIFNDYIYKGQVSHIPCSSDYSANLEIFNISNNNLTEMWRKNPIFCRFGYQNSNSNSDYPYLLNNNDIHGDFNRSVDTTKIIPDRSSRNLDYFYTLNSGTTSYINHSLHVEKNVNDGSHQDNSFRFELTKYLNTHQLLYGTQSATYSQDYFEYLFGGEKSFLDGQIILNSEKYSRFNYGDNSVPNTTLFKGLKFKIFGVDNIKIEDGSITNLNLFTDNKFQDYKLSILLSENLEQISGTTIENSINWGHFIDNSYEVGTVSFVTSLSASPSNVNVGDIVEISQFYPYINEEYQGISNVIISGSLNFGVYGFAINKEFEQSTPANPGYYKINTQWDIIKNWESETLYDIGDQIIYEDVIYDVIGMTNSLTDPSQNPTNNSNYILSDVIQPFWNPGYTYSSGNWVYRQGEYYQRSSSTYSRSGDFWHSTFTYSESQYAIMNGRFYKNTISQSLPKKPQPKSRSLDMTSTLPQWKEDPLFNTPISSSTHSSLWNPIQMWNENDFYSNGKMVVHDDVLYRLTSDSSSGDRPDISSIWSRIYSFKMDSDFIYGTQSNPIVKMNDTMYLCTFNKGYKLNSGITIYINKKWKNILINININDNTCPDIKNIERDYLYNELNSRLTAANFIRQINDLDSKYGFANYTSYVVIEEDGSFKKYDMSNIDELPYLILCEEPDNFEVNNNTQSYKSITVDKNILKPVRELNNGNIDNPQKINYYNDIPLGCEIKRNVEEKFAKVNYSGSKNTSISDKSYVSPKGNLSTSTTLYRHSGPYMPVFYPIQLFSSINEIEIQEGNANQYTILDPFDQGSPSADRMKFNENLSLFGVLRQRIMSKVNRNGSVLKLRYNDSVKSIYPMLDEFGYTTSDFFLFKSTWDFEYHLECVPSKVKIDITSLPTQPYYINQIVQNS